MDPPIVFPARLESLHQSRFDGYQPHTHVNPSDLLREDKTMTVLDLAPHWPNVEYPVQAVILEELTRDLKSFNLACRSLQLFRQEIQEFLTKHKQEPKAQSYIIGREQILFGCRFLEAYGLSRFATLIRAHAGRNNGWPRPIDYSDLDPEQFQGRVYSTPLTGTPKPKPESVVLSFKYATTLGIQGENICNFRLESFTVPDESIVVCNDMAIRLKKAGKYTLLYPPNFAALPPDAVHVLIQPNAERQSTTTKTFTQTNDLETCFFRDALPGSPERVRRSLQNYLLRERSPDSTASTKSSPGQQLISLPWQNMPLQPRKDAIGPMPSPKNLKLQELHNKGFKALLQFKAPEGALIITPDNEAMRFLHGGDATVVPADQEAFLG
ncbi:hypothetical protein F5Y04DRAFT_274908 [Hypomontagnella monticulosa]|nr:hypothetical protein F5Y04DRAFT_274908 [Hypomontagnella monticulosa]